ncbi:MAG: protease inhibitor I42 family protein [Dehalococcoidales bacterium]|nr:MAG: protease inhibitor I42 family protein [Dehalococcoidales bacterium]
MTVRWRILLIGIVAIAISLVVVYFPDTNMPLTVTCEDFTEQGGIVNEDITVSAWVDLLTITLCSNRTTGFEWELKEITGKEDMLSLKESEYFPPDEGAVGAAGTEVWTFGVYRKGSGNITMEYSQPWEDGIKANWTYHIEIDAH